MDMLEISTFRVRNFKSIKDSGTVDISNLNVLIGKNDAGKSSMLEALRCFLRKKKPDPNQFHKQDAGEIVLTATFTGITDDFRDVLGDDYSIKDDEVKIERKFESRKDGNPGQDTFFNDEKLSMGAIVDDDTRLTKPQSRNYIWEHFLPDPIWISAERDVNEETKLKGGTVLNRLLEPILKDGGIDETDSFQDNVTELEKSLKGTAASIGEDLTERMQSHMSDVATIEVDPGSVQLLKAISPTISIKDEYLDESVDIAERGSGIGSLLVLSLMQTYVDMQVGEGYCLLFEEPENFLHPAAERKMLSALKEIADEGQVYISTHSQVMIDGDRDVNMNIVRRNNGVTDFEYVNDDVFAAIDEIGARNSDLLQSDFVIYVEGPTDVGVVSEIAEQAIDDWDTHNIVIQHLGGMSNITHCEPQQLRKINRNFAILLDSDRQTSDTDPSQDALNIKEKCNIVNRRCKILEKRAIENYYSSEAINSACDLSVEESFVTDYDDMAQKIGEKIANEHIPSDEIDNDNMRKYFGKVDKGKTIIEWMYDNGQSIDEIEEFLQENISHITDN